jgi:glycosyltransferase involved in cell wall biosynthesis
VKILIVNAAAFLGGAEEWVLSLIRHLGPRGHAIEVAHHPRSALGDRALEAGAAAAWVPHSRFAGVVRTALSLARMIRRESYDVVVSTTRSDLVPAGFAARQAGHPGVVARLNSGMSVREPVVRAGWRWRRHRWYHRHLVHRAATNSEAGRADLVARGFLPPERIEVIYNGVDLDRFDSERVPRGRFRHELGISESTPLVVSIARYAPGRGQEDELEAVLRLATARPALHVAFIGSCGPKDESFKAGLAARAAARPGGDRIHFLGPRHDVPEVLADTDVLMRVLTTEGLANVVLEAMAMRVPVVAANISGMPEAVTDGDTGLLVAPADVGAIERAVAELLDAAPERRAAMGEKGRAHVCGRFSLERMADRYEALFARAMAERGEAGM